MPAIRLTPEQCEALWVGRSDLWVEGFTLCRARVAIRCVERAYRNWFAGTDKYYFATQLLRSLDAQRHRGYPHPLHWEITAFLKHYTQGGDRRTFYAGLCHTRAKRAIHKVMLPGR